jgi:hypothetical protein
MIVVLFYDFTAKVHDKNDFPAQGGEKTPAGLSRSPGRY